MTSPSMSISTQNRSQKVWLPSAMPAVPAALGGEKQHLILEPPCLGAVTGSGCPEPVVAPNGGGCSKSALGLSPTCLCANVRALTFFLHSSLMPISLCDSIVFSNLFPLSPFPPWPPTFFSTPTKIHYQNFEDTCVWHFYP